MHRSVIRLAALVCGATLALLPAVPARAHLHVPVGALEATIGWGSEPAFVGFPNAVFVALERPAAHAEGEAHEEGDEHEGEPVAGAQLTVEVIFGGRDGTTKSDPLDLEPVFGEPGAYEADLIPTAPGTYTFHVSGTAGKAEIDEFFTSGEVGANEGTRYDDVQQAAAVQFPLSAPVGGELTERLDRLDARLAAVASDADAAGTKGLMGLVVGVVAVLVGIAGFVAGRASKR